MSKSVFFYRFKFVNLIDQEQRDFRWEKNN